MGRAWCLLILILAMILPSNTAEAKSLIQATEEIATYFSKSAVQIKPDSYLLIRVENLHSKQRDQLARIIETELYLSLEKQSPDFKFSIYSKSTVAVQNPDMILVKGTYQQEGDQVFLRFQAMESSERAAILAQFHTTYQTSRQLDKNLVAALDIEGNAFNREEAWAYSDIFRSFLIETNQFELVSAAEVRKMNPEAIQQTANCSRDECATLIGEQLGLDHVISSSLFRTGDTSWVVSAKLIDVKKGTIIRSATVKHEVDLSTLDTSLKKLAFKLAGIEQPSQEKHTEGTSQEKTVGKSNLIWHISAISLGLGSALFSKQLAASYNDLADENDSLNRTYRSDPSQSDLKDQYEENQDKMGRYKNQIQILDAITLLAIGWEVYLLFWDDSENSDDDVAQNRWIPEIKSHCTENKFSTNLSWQVRF